MTNKITPMFRNEIQSVLMSAVGSIPNLVSKELKSSFYFKGRKSDALAQRIISSLTESDDIILDPFFGGGRLDIEDSHSFHAPKKTATFL